MSSPVVVQRYRAPGPVPRMIPQAGNLSVPALKQSIAGTTYEGGGNTCVFYYPFDLADPNWVVTGLFFPVAKPIVTSSVEITAGLVEASNLLQPTLTVIGGGENFDLVNTSIMYTDTSLSFQGTTPKAVRAPFATPIRFTGGPRRIFLCVVYEPSWTGTSNEAYVSHPLAGAAAFRVDTGAATYNPGVMPASLGTLNVNVGDYFLGFNMYLTLDQSG